MPIRHAAMLEVNEFLVLDFVRDQGSTSRPEIGRALELSAASVSRMVGRLLRSGLVVEGGRSPSDGGRPPGLISFNRRAGAVIAISLGAASCHGALADLAGDILHEETQPTRQHGTAFGTLVAVIDALSGEATRLGVPVSALAVGVPAIIDPETGIGLAGPSVEWKAFDIVSALAQNVDVPFVVENDVNLAALAQAWRGDGRNTPDFFALYLGAGVGGAVVSSGSLVKGRHNGGGEIGYLLVDREEARLPLLETIGGLEAAISEAGLVSRARALAASRGLPETAAGPLTVGDIFEGAATGEPVAGQVVAELLDLVAMALVAVSAIVDPALVILDGSVGRALEPYVPVLAETLARRLPWVPRLVVSSLGGDSPLLGAVAAALELARRRSAPSALFGAFSISGGAHGMR
jgi:glucokinase